MKRLIVLALVMVFLVSCSVQRQYSIEEIQSYYPTREEWILLNELVKCDTDEEFDKVIHNVSYDNYHFLGNKILKLMDIYYWQPEGLFWVDLFAQLVNPSKRINVYLTYSTDLAKKFGYNKSYNYYQDDEEIEKLKRKLRDVEDLLGFIITELERRPPQD